MDFLKENWRWILFPIVIVLVIGCAMILLAERDGLDAHRYNLGWLLHR